MPSKNKHSPTGHAARYVAGAWFATQLFFLFGTTLPIFQNFDRPHAGEIVRVLFPMYYSANFFYAVLFVGFLLFSRNSLTRWKISLALALLAAVCVALLQFAVAPKLAEFRTGGQLAAFDRLHSLSMTTNTVTMLCTLLSGLLFGVRPKAESSSEHAS